MSASNSAGIALLLEAEKEAANIVQQSRQYRINRLKEARDQAQKEAQDVKKQFDNKFEQWEKDNTGAENDLIRSFQKTTDENCNELREMFAKNKDKVVEVLLESVVRVEPKVHKNAKYEKRNKTAV